MSLLIKYGLESPSASGASPTEAANGGPDGAPRGLFDLSVDDEPPPPMAPAGPGPAPADLPARHGAPRAS